MKHQSIKKALILPIFVCFSAVAGDMQERGQVPSYARNFMDIGTLGPVDLIESDSSECLAFQEIIPLLGQDTIHPLWCSASPMEYKRTDEEWALLQRNHYRGEKDYACGSLTCIEDVSTGKKISTDEKYKWVVTGHSFDSNGPGDNQKEKLQDYITGHSVFLQTPGPNYAVIAFKPGNGELPDSIKTVVGVPKEWHDWITAAFAGYPSLTKKSPQELATVLRDAKGSPFFKAAAWHRVIAGKGDVKAAMEALWSGYSDVPWTTAIVLGAAMTDFPASEQAELAPVLDGWAKGLLVADPAVSRHLYEFVIAMGTGLIDAATENPVTFQYRPDAVRAEFCRQRIVPILDHVAKTPDAQLSQWGKALKAVSGPDSDYREVIERAATKNSVK